MIGVKMNSFSDNSGEPEQDANSALTELDKGLRSGKVGEQCEAIVRFPRLFEKYPFPILINSSFLKLADVFRMGNNFLRLWVLRVCQQSEKHLDKILNVDEFLRRVFSVLHSNDPVARALTLRTLGAVAGIIPERQNVHHAIRRGLDSHDNVEVEAAIYATTRFAAHSNAFAVAMCNKLTDMIECESTGAERREKLVLALRTVHGGAVRAQGVLKLLRSLLERFPSSGSVRASIVALTAIASDTVVHVPDQVELLLQIATDDPRRSVRRAALTGLKQLAEHAALWPSKCIQDLLTVAECDTGHGMMCLQVMKILVECPAVCANAGASPGGSRSPLVDYCINAALSTDLCVAATAATVLTKIIVHCYEECLPVESGSDLILVLESLVIATGAEDTKSNITSLRKALSCLVQLCNAEPTAYAQRTAYLLGTQLHACARDRVSRQTGLLEAIAALGGSVHSPMAVIEAMDSVETVLEDVIENPTPEMDGTALVLLCTIIFQERAGVSLTMKITSDWEPRVLQCIAGYDGWTRYRVARAALRYGHYNIAAAIIRVLHAQAECESSQRWLHTLWQAAEAETMLDDIDEAAARWQVCAGGGDASAAAACPSQLPRAALRARAAALAALSDCGGAARALCTQPPPAIAQASRDAASKSGACAGAIRRAARALSATAAMYGDMARSAFHADDETLNLLYISQHIYNQLSQFLDRITCSEQSAELVIKEWKPRTLEEKIALAPSVELANIASKLFDNPTTGPGITHRHAEAIRFAARVCSHSGSWARLSLSARARGPLCRLAVCPAPRAPPADHAAALPTSHRLALKMEAVLLLPPLSKRQPRRQVKSVQITVTATPHSRNSDKTVELSSSGSILTAVQTVTPVRDFFSAQQLISVSTAGLYTVAVEAAFIDEKGQLWNTGPKTSIVVKAHDDPGAKGNSQNARGRF